MSHSDPIFKPIFGNAWETLPPVLHKRYSNRPFSNDINTVEGKMEIKFSKTMSYLMPLFKLLHVLVPYSGKDIPVKVDFRSQTNSDAVFLDRTFYFPAKEPYEYNSRMRVIKNNEVIEYMAFGVGWKTHY